MTPPQDKDEVAAAKASLELMVMENKHLVTKFGGLLSDLEEMQKLPAPQRHEKFKALEKTGAFQFKGVDIRHFKSGQANQPLPPSLFLERTQRRLQNTALILKELASRGGFDRSAQLQEAIAKLTSRVVDPGSPRDVQDFRSQVVSLHDDELFKSYLQAKKDFISKDQEMRTEVEMLTTKETLGDNLVALKANESSLTDLKTKMESGEVAPAVVMEQLDHLDPAKGLAGK
ncbi:MAG: hypothetical protein OEV94_00755 [Deltaproteobacteria bacterium]|nr:hypothetical protein [Deltaproteobacteria bacterium]